MAVHFAGASGASAITASLVGPALAPTALTMLDTAIKHISVQPQTNCKGSVNCGGGGGGGPSCCKKKAPCGGCKKKSKSCGGGGGGCSKSKKQCEKKIKFKVVFKSFRGQSVVKTVQVEKDSDATGEAPWMSQEDAPTETLNDTQYVWTTEWATSSGDKTAIREVKKDLELTAVYRDIITGSEYGGTANTQIINSMDEDSQQVIQNFYDDCSNSYNSCVNNCAQCINDIEETICGSPTATMENYMDDVGRGFNTEFTITTGKYEGIMNILPAYAHPENLELSECTDFGKFNDTKKCILNLQSTFVFQTRMMLNNELDTVIKKIDSGVEELENLVRDDGEDPTQKAEELKEDILLMLDDCNIDNNNRWEEYKENFNKYIDDINSCFPSKPLSKI